MSEDEWEEMSEEEIREFRYSIMEFGIQFQCAVCKDGVDEDDPELVNVCLSWDNGKQEQGFWAHRECLVRVFGDNGPLGGGVDVVHPDGKDKHSD